MKLIQDVFLSVNVCLSHRSQRSVRAFSLFSNPGTDDNQSNNSFESEDDLVKRIWSDTGGTYVDSNSFSKFNFRKISTFLDGLDESSNTLSDGMDDKLKRAATDFDVDVAEMEQEDFAFRPDVEFQSGTTYEPKE